MTTVRQRIIRLTKDKKRNQELTGRGPGRKEDMQCEDCEALAFEVDAVQSRLPFGRLERKLWRVLLQHAVQLHLDTTDDILAISM